MSQDGRLNRGEDASRASRSEDLSLMKFGVI
eukprot:CAMPEP_0183421170 /NCGR_PEP_ID=MMETSP0370-20130417/26921_1 /TAXON_ID=268820 /ORGANISM="Peridinium aciculiferum, Strain PAER-2" /LENGTH=30 /DNA_ID= /DNA_START= /DNA_END= /DNA_ORIENTATION=